MTELTRRRDPDADLEIWHLFSGVVNQKGRRVSQRPFHLNMRCALRR